VEAPNKIERDYYYSGKLLRGDYYYSGSSKQNREGLLL
jgi:hypothetical protein